MPIRNFCIRIAANGICLLRSRTLRASDARLLIFTGTSGKTLARTACAYGLRKAGLPVVSPPYGYTNELGISLAALGIGSVRLLSLEGLRKVFTARPPQGAYICVELGADWRRDIPWFIRRFRPYGVCITNTSADVWTRSLEDIWSDKRKLAARIPQEGFLAWSTKNESIQAIHAMKTADVKCRTIEFEASPGDLAFEYKSSVAPYSFRSASSGFAPYTEAFGAAVACVEAVGKKPLLAADFFSAYEAPRDRLSRRLLGGGALLISDTYKAVPQCMNYVLGFALALPAKKRIAVVSAMHPLWRNAATHYRHLGSLLDRFDGAYFIGPPETYALVKSSSPRSVYAGDKSVQDLAAMLKNHGPETVIVIKTAGRYRMQRLAEALA